MRSQADFDASVRELGTPAILKTAGFGYDGKGQTRVDSPEAWKWTPDSPEMIYEALVDYEREVSVVAARSTGGQFAHWGVIENDHVNGILDV